MRFCNLTVDTAAPYLIEHNFIDIQAIVDGDLDIVDAGRRNQNLRIARQHGPGYLIKQPGAGEFATDATIRCEAWFYSYCQGENAAAELRDWLPVLRGWDQDRGILVLELIDGYPLWTHYASRADTEFPADAAAPLGHALGTLHRIFRPEASRPGWMADLMSGPPWILFAHRPTPELYTRLSPANLQVLKLLQGNHPLTEGLDMLRNEWVADTLIHNDIKGENILVSANGDVDVRLRLVDWELIQIGDAAWDIGAVLRDFLNYWLLSVPLSGDLTAEQMLEGAGVPLAKLHPAARAFWQAYRATARIESASAPALLHRALRYAAARLAQGAYELSSSMHEPSNLAVAMLQLAANIFSDSHDASLHLLGIPVGWPRSGNASRHG